MYQVNIVKRRIVLMKKMKKMKVMEIKTEWLCGDILSALGVVAVWRYTECLRRCGCVEIY